ncbi:MAG: hypothetical protein K1X67_07680 [Fimbriimonadaceae bacterium]|nr:hypothetical protein [Fimbriimonadaceae bacterium]
MIEIQINRLPGGDASRRTTMARITLTNTGEGLGGVKVYDIRMAEVDERVRGEVISTEGRTHREIEDGILGLVQRALGRLTEPPRRGSQSP